MEQEKDESFGKEKLMVTPTNRLTNQATSRPTNRLTNRANIVQSAFQKIGKQKAEICNLAINYRKFCPLVTVQNIVISLLRQKRIVLCAILHFILVNQVDQPSEVEFTGFPRHLEPPALWDFPSTAVTLRSWGVIQCKAQLLEGKGHDERSVSPSSSGDHHILCKHPTCSGLCSKMHKWASRMWRGSSLIWEQNANTHQPQWYL